MSRPSGTLLDIVGRDPTMLGMSPGVCIWTFAAPT
jgi:hypothetical protein